MSSNKEKILGRNQAKTGSLVAQHLYSPMGIGEKEFYFICLYSCFANSMNDKITT